MTTWVPVPDGSDFPLENLPYGVFSHADRERRVGVAIGEHVLDLTAAAEAGLLESPEMFTGGTLNPFLGAGPNVWGRTRDRVTELLTDDRASAEPALVAQRDATLLLPITVGDYVDFYSSLEHASNLGRMFRPDSDPLLPNWRHLPVGYHGRASTVVVSGTPVRRPRGQTAPAGDGRPGFGPSQRLDIELEVGFVTGPGNAMGTAIAADDAERHIFGLVLVNDWSARDIQAWEYQPLGPFLGKSFATTISPWVVPLAALEPYRVPQREQDPPVLDYLRTTGHWGLDLELRVELNGADISATNFRRMYWTMAQQLAHATVNGTAIRPGDLYASGTVSGAEQGTQGSLIELTWKGERPLTMADGSTRTFLEDGDEVVLRGWCGGDAPARPRVGFGECRGTIHPALTS